MSFARIRGRKPQKQMAMVLTGQKPIQRARKDRTPEPVLSLLKESVRGLLGNWQFYCDDGNLSI
jgi:hypothetical protein